MTSEELLALRRAEALRAVDRLVPLLLFFIAALARLALVLSVSHPGLDDPAFYLRVAENLAAGRGFTIDVLWTYQIPFASVTHPSNEHWMPLASLIIAPLFAAFGPSFQLAQTAGAVLGALLAPVTWHITREALAPVGRWRGHAALAGTLIALNPLLAYQAVTVDSATPFALAAALALWLGSERAVRAPGFAVATGLAAGLAYLARSEGLLLIAVLAGWVVWRAVPPVRLRQTALVMAAALAVVLPWWARNLAAFGTPLPSSALVLALLPDYAALFHFGAEGFWDGFPTPGFATLFGLRLQGLGHNLGVLFMQALFIVAPFGVVALVRLRARPPLLLGGCFGAALLLVTALAFPVATQHGTFNHAVGAVLPFVAAAGAVGLFRAGAFLGNRIFHEATFTGVMVCIATLVLVLVQLILAATLARDLHGNIQREMAAAGDLLKGQGYQGVVMTTQPYSLHHATGLPAIALPAGDAIPVARAAAARYGARYIVGFGRFGRYPDALSGAPGFTPLVTDGNLWAYRIDAP